METPMNPPGAGTFNGAPPKPNNWLVPAILVTILCCNLLGVIGVVYAARVDTKYVHGDYAGAADDARQARLWTLIPVAVGVLFWILYAVFFGAAIMSNMGQFRNMQ
jgi:hypothetical protein